MELTVEPSVISIGGSARVQKSALQGLGIDDGGLAVIRSEKKDVLLNVFPDGMLDDGIIKLRKVDMDKLSVQEGDKVKMMAHESILKKGLMDKLL